MSATRRHCVFLALLGAGIAVRAIACLAYHPALWFSDSLGYSALGLHPYPTLIRPAGYPLLLLWPLHRLHSYLAVVIVQHTLGLASGIIVYALLVRRRLRTWVAALAAAPVLLSAYQIQIEHFILSDSLFAFLLIAAIAVLLWNPRPGWLGCVLAGLLLGAAAITRSEGTPLIVAFLAWMLIQRTSWRAWLGRAAVVCAAFALPVISYAGWFNTAYGHYQLTYSTGAFLASRAESFANCQTDAIPRSDQWLCATKPGLNPDRYIWAHGMPLATVPGGAFSRVNNQRETSFALHVFVGQPEAYLLSTWRGVLQNFSSGGTAYSDGQAAFAFPADTPQTVAALARANPGNPTTPIYSYDAHPSTRVSQPWADILQFYQHVIVLPPTLVGMITFVALLGAALAWKRRGGPGLLPLLVGLVLLVFPAATSGFGSRYELVSTSALCMAAVLGAAEVRGFSAMPASPRSRSRVRVERVAALGAVAGVLVAGCAVATHVKALQPPHHHKIVIPSGGTFQRGVDLDVYTHPGQNVPATARADIAYVKGLHANAVAISFPFFMAGRHASAVYTTPSTPTPAQLATIITIAHQAGLYVSVRPLLDEHSLGFCRCQLTLRHPRAWFKSYSSFLLPYAIAAQKAGAQQFFAGAELSTTAHFLQWARVNAALARVFHGKITYTENYNPGIRYGAYGGAGQTVDAYPPLSPPFLRGWEQFDAGLPEGAVLSEVGIDAVAGAWHRPYKHAWPHPVIDPGVQARWFAAACRAARVEHLGGVYFWAIGFWLGTRPGAGPMPTLQGQWGGAGAQAVSQCFAQIESHNA